MWNGRSFLIILSYHPVYCEYYLLVRIIFSSNLFLAEMIPVYAALTIMMLFIIAPINVLWLHFMFFLQKLVWNVLIGRTCLYCCGGKGRYGGSKSWHFSWSIHRKQRWGEKLSVIEIVAPMIVTESPPREYSRSSYLSLSIYLPISLADSVTLLSPLCRSSRLSSSHSPFCSLTVASSLLPFVLSLSFSLFLCGL